MRTSVASLFLMFLFQNLRLFLYTGSFLPLADILSICKREGGKKPSLDLMGTALWSIHLHFYMVSCTLL